VSLALNSLSVFLMLYFAKWPLFIDEDIYKSEVARYYEDFEANKAFLIKEEKDQQQKKNKKNKCLK